MQDEMSEKSLTLGVRVGKTTAKELQRAIGNLLAVLKSQTSKTTNNIKGKSSELKHGKQTMKELAKHNAGLTSIELKDPNLRLLHQTMKQNGVDFAPVKDGKGKYTLFFKGRDADALTHAFSAYTKKVTERANKQTIGATLVAMKKAAKTLADSRDKVKNLNKGAREI
jgi:hypothetical protein